MHDMNDNYEFIEEVRKKKMLDQVSASYLIRMICLNQLSLIELCYLLDAKEGYKVLGYKSFKECVIVELKGVLSYPSAFKYKEAARMHMIVCPELPLGKVREGHFRLISHLNPEEMKIVWEEAKKLCDDLDPRPPSSDEIKRALRNCELHTVKAKTKVMEGISEYVLFQNSPKLQKKLEYIIDMATKEILEEFCGFYGVKIQHQHIKTAIRGCLEVIESAISEKYYQEVEKQTNKS